MLSSARNRAKRCGVLLLMTIVSLSGLLTGCDDVVTAAYDDANQVRLTVISEGNGSVQQ